MAKVNYDAAWDKACDAWVDQMDIEALRDEAREAGDEDMVGACELALAGDKHAWEECLEVWRDSMISHAVALLEERNDASQCERCYGERE